MQTTETPNGIETMLLVRACIWRAMYWKMPWEAFASAVAVGAPLVRRAMISGSLSEGVGDDREVAAVIHPWGLVT